MLKVNKSNFLPIIVEAENSTAPALKNLNQKERKALHLFIQAAQSQAEEVESPLSSQELGKLRKKLKSSSLTYRQSSFIIRILKAIANFFKFRISTESIQLDLKKHHFNNYKKTIPSILLSMKTDPEDLTSHIHQHAKIFQVEENGIHAGHLKDVKRGLFSVTIEEEFSKNKRFSNNSSLVGECALNDFKKGLDDLFLENERDWRLLTESMISQTPFNALVDPLYLSFNISETGLIPKSEVGGITYIRFLNTNHLDKNVNVIIKRNEVGGIESLHFSFKANLPLTAYDDREDLKANEVKKKDVMANIEVHQSFDASLDEDKNLILKNFDYAYTLK
ncbi:hypothetical protein [Criblamydia sequanensis]|uniref:Uncharacterized protein n=1 Tax=Candidatus Criblamydia sequanensis CRIB-18 TaxID=1437425 RepID=A0A090CZG5_9BACT|nr:hypothetical protein [Criblamydia sequanensis]CDR34271.1 hypothetical protein CSEC_1457 [Criblamydia sequanensis CRIB-18]